MLNFIPLVILSICGQKYIADAIFTCMPYFFQKNNNNL